MCSQSTATQLRYRCIDYLSSAAQHNALHVKFTSLQYSNAIVGAETEVRPLQLIATQIVPLVFATKLIPVNPTYRIYEYPFNILGLYLPLLVYTYNVNQFVSVLSFLQVKKSKKRKKERVCLTHQESHNSALILLTVLASITKYLLWYLRPQQLMIIFIYLYSSMPLGTTQLCIYIIITQVL